MTGCEHLLVIASRYPFGSQEAYLGTELAALREHVPRITVAPLRAGGGNRMHEMPQGIELLTCPLGGMNTYARATRTALRHPRATLAAVTALLFSRDPGKLKNFAILPKALALAGWARANNVTHVHGYWFSTPSTAAFVIGTIAGIPWSATAHRWDIYERNAFDVKATRAAFIRTISSRGSADMRERIGTAGRVVELRLGTEIPQRFAARHDVRSRPFHVLSPAALVPVKGHADLLEALAIVRREGMDIRCTLAGRGPEREALEAQAHDLRIDDAVHFAGHVPHDVLLEMYRTGTIDAVVLASRNDGPSMMEGLPSALIEALAYAIPVIATDSGSISELVTPDSGYLVPARSPAMIAAALRAIYESPLRARSRALCGRRRVIELHDVRTQMRTLAELLTTAKGTS